MIPSLFIRYRKVERSSEVRQLNLQRFLLDGILYLAFLFLLIPKESNFEINYS